ncbi:MAG: hypothetical protein C0466_08130 [Candidatus Accumulibacter sp.]|nr:hypothetical protein [Accumulibacter sp.]
MLGPLVNSAVLIVGGISGAALGRRIPRRVREALPLTCGIISIGVGVVLMNKVHAIPPVALALLAGALIGELLCLERGLELAIGWAQKHAERVLPGDRGNPRIEGFVARFVTILVLFCASGMGIFGATHEGMTGDADILIAKSVLDLFTAMIFATELGYAVALIAIPQILIQSALYFGAFLLVPLATPSMLADFSACGGIVMLATGLRVCGIKIFPIVNMLPALVLAMPCSALWSRFFA